MANDRIWRLLTRKLSGEATRTELEELELYLRESPDEGKDVHTVTDWWETNPNTNTEFLEATYFAHLQRMKAKGFHLSDEPASLKDTVPIELVPSPPFIKFYWKYLLAASVTLILIVGSWFIFSQAKEKPTMAAVRPAEILTRYGARSKILLPDGSSVWLNSGSRISYDKDFETGPNREVNLTGEAFFDVVKNSARPFVIHTSKIDIRVLGTRFNVKAYDNDKTTETSLIRGSVEVFLKNNPKEKYLLKPNQKLVLLNETAQKDKSISLAKLSAQAALHIEIMPLTYLPGTKTDIESSWTKNILSFEDEPFSEVAKKMERWYDVSISFKNKRWESEFLNGSFEKENLEQAMNALQYSTGFEYKTEGKNILIY